MESALRRRWRRSVAVTAALAALVPVVTAQDAGRAGSAIATWIALDAAPGRETGATDLIMRSQPGWERDALGSLILRRGSGSPRRVVACGLDQASYVVSEITGEGYLRLHGAGFARRSVLWDQFHEGQRVRVVTAAGPVPGVVAVRSTHLWRRRTADTSVTTVDDLWVDLGARSREEVRALGVAVLDPVVREWPSWRYAEFVAGPGAAARAGCAAIAASSRLKPASGETIFVLSAQSSINYTGLSAVLASLGTIDTLTLVDPNIAPGDTSDPVPTRRAATLPFDLPATARVRATMLLGVRASFRGSLVESVQEGDAAVLLADVDEAAGVAPAAQRETTSRYPTLRPVLAPNVRAGARDPRSRPRTRRAESRSRPRPAPRDSLAAVADLLSRLTNTYGVSGHEARVRDVVRNALPPWARAISTTDTAGNLSVAIGPDRDTVVFMAHLDEIGFEITEIASDGQVALRPRGGFFPSLFEGQPALLHLDTRPPADTIPAMLRGVFLPRRSATAKQPAELKAWFGVDSAALVARGVAPGQSITSWKRATRLGKTRFTARSIDDRAGSTALVLALERLNRGRLKRKVIFAWSTREETALAGAAAMAARLGTSVRRVHAVDTFVSSDSPLESSRFAHAPIGRGAVVRALDNSSVASPAETERVVAIARAARIPLQVGTTNGGNDGSMFTRYGATDVPISWPLRYSHSPAELIDLADVLSLARLVTAIAQN